MLLRVANLTEDGTGQHLLAISNELRQTKEWAPLLLL